MDTYSYLIRFKVAFDWNHQPFIFKYLNEKISFNTKLMIKMKDLILMKIKIQGLWEIILMHIKIFMLCS